MYHIYALFFFTQLFYLLIWNLMQKLEKEKSAYDEKKINVVYVPPWRLK